MSSQWLNFFSVLVGLMGAAAALIPFLDAKKKNGRVDLSYSHALLSHEKFSAACLKSWRTSSVISSISYLAIVFGSDIPGLGLPDNGIGNFTILPTLLILSSAAFQGLLIDNLALKDFKLLDNYLNRYNYSIFEYVKDALWASWVLGVLLLIPLSIVLDFGTSNFYRLAFLAQLTASLCSCSSAHVYAYTTYRTMYKVAKFLIVTREPMQTFDNLVELKREDDAYVALLREKDCINIVTMPLDNIAMVRKTLDVKSSLLEYHLDKKRNKVSGKQAKAAQDEIPARQDRENRPS